jgi:hypothetical protein
VILLRLNLAATLSQLPGPGDAGEYMREGLGAGEQER